MVDRRSLIKSITTGRIIVSENTKIRTGDYFVGTKPPNAHKWMTFTKPCDAKTPSDSYIHVSNCFIPSKIYTLQISSRLRRALSLNDRWTSCGRRYCCRHIHSLPPPPLYMQCIDMYRLEGSGFSPLLVDSSLIYRQLIPRSRCTMFFSECGRLRSFIPQQPKK